MPDGGVLWSPQGGYLAEQSFCKSMVEGFQGDDLKEPYKVAACVKHFAALRGTSGGEGISHGGAV